MSLPEPEVVAAAIDEFLSERFPDLDYVLAVPTPTVPIPGQRGRIYMLGVLTTTMFFSADMLAFASRTRVWGWVVLAISAFGLLGLLVGEVAARRWVRGLR